MPSKRILINSPTINELVFDKLYNMNEQQRLKFTPKELRAFKSSKKARVFVERSTLDEKLLILAKLGIGWAFELFGGASFTPASDRYKKYEEMTKLQMVDEAVNENFVVLTDRVAMNYLSVMSDLTHSDVYLLNLDFHKVGSAIMGWKKIWEPDTKSLQESIENAAIINRLILNSLLEAKKMRGSSDVADIEFVLLLFLYDNRKEYVPREMIINRFAGLYKKTIITTAIKRMVDKNHSFRNPVYSNIHEYQITSLGISAIMDFHKRNLKMTV